MEENLPRHRANSRKARQETSIMYARARKPDLSGEIFAKCTPRQRFPILKSAKYAILAKMGCPRVHFSEILPERGPSAAQAYIMLVSCHSVMFCPRAGALGTLGVDGAVAAAISEPLMRGGVSWGRWDSCCDGVQIPRAGMRLAAGSAGVSTFLVILVLWLV